MKPTAIICDIDGTLAHMAGRSPYDPTKYHEDIVDEVIRTVVNVFEDFVILIVSGRADTGRDVTHKWLRDNGVYYDYLLMREAGDKREDSIIKQEIYERYIKPKYNVLFVLDDRNRVVKMWREQGLKCLQVQEGDF